MRTHDLTLPELFFIVGTRAMLAAGVAFLVAGKLSKSQRTKLGVTLLSLGVATTIPAGMIVFGKGEPVPDKIEPG